MKIIESPRDAIKSISQFIETEQKAKYINSLLRIGFHTIDFGSFVSPESSPQMADTEEVLKLLDLSTTSTSLQVKVDSIEGAQKALEFDEISCVSFNFTTSNTLAQLKSHTSVKDLFSRAITIHDLCKAKGKDFELGYSAAFGSPYGDSSEVDDIAEWVYKFDEHDISTIMLTDSTGDAMVDNIVKVFGNLTGAFPEIEIGLHLHTEPYLYGEKVNAAFLNGCKRFNTVINGMGGCSLSDNNLVGNLRTGSLISYLEKKGVAVPINRMAFLDAVQIAKEIFPFVPPTY